MTAESFDRQTSETADRRGPQTESGEPFFLEADHAEPSSEAKPSAEKTTPPSQAVDDAPPWFAQQKTGSPRKSKQPRKRKPGRRGDSSKKRTAKSRVQPKQEEEEEALTWQEQLKRWTVGVGGMGYGVSLLVHLVLLVMFSIMAVKGLVGEDDFSTVVTETDEEEIVFEEIADTSIEMPAEDEIMQAELKPFEAPSKVIEPSVSTLFDSLSDSKDGETGSAKFKFSMPKSGKAVTKGSFTAWTVPEDPSPGENYQIVIQIKLPAKLRRYPSKDLSGKVVGTDGYEQEIPSGKTERYLPIKEDQTQLVITVPGAAKLVKDRIEIKSKLLGEQQILEIEF